jgi:hypothetical protein
VIWNPYGQKRVYRISHNHHYRCAKHIHEPSMESFVQGFFCVAQARSTLQCVHDSTRLWAQSSLCVYYLTRTRKGGGQAFFRLEAFYELGTRLFLAEPLRWAMRLIIGAQVPGWCGTWQLSCLAGLSAWAAGKGFFSLFEIDRFVYSSCT